MVSPSGCFRISIAAHSSLREPARSPPSSLWSIVMSSLSASAMAADHQRHRERPGLRVEIFHPPAFDAGLLQRLAPHRVLDALRPARRSRRGTTTWSAAKRPERPSKQRSPRTASMMTTGSVRGKCSTLQAGQARFQPASTMSVVAPQLEQKRCRACQCSIALASASGGRCSGATSPCTAIERRSVTNEIVARLQRLGAGLASMPMPKRAAPSSRPRNTVSVLRRERARLVRREHRIVRPSPFFSTISSPPIT